MLEVNHVWVKKVVCFPSCFLHSLYSQLAKSLVMARKEKTAQHSVLLENAVIHTVSTKWIYRIAGKQGNWCRELFLATSGQVEPSLHFECLIFSSDLTRQITFLPFKLIMVRLTKLEYFHKYLQTSLLSIDLKLLITWQFGIKPSPWTIVHF